MGDLEREIEHGEASPTPKSLSSILCKRKVFVKEAGERLEGREELYRCQELPSPTKIYNWAVLLQQENNT